MAIPRSSRRDATVARCVEFCAERAVRIVEEPVAPPGPGEVRVATEVSAVSAGTERLVYRGRVPAEAPVDETLAGLDGTFAWPVRYGYSAVGTVVDVGPGVSVELVGRRVFAFQPHRSVFVAPAHAVVLLPPDLHPEAAAFLPGVETALALVMDGRPLFGERVLVVGQGVVGLLATALLSRMPLDVLVAVDPLEERRRRARVLGAPVTASPDDDDVLAAALGDGADLAYEVSGNPAALDVALGHTGREGRVVVGSWYGTARAPVELGTRFHRGRLRVRSSQVSHLDPALRGRWTKDRRLGFALRLLADLRPRRLVTHRIPVQAAGVAYRLLDERPDEALQVLLTYGSPTE